MSTDTIRLGFVDLETTGLWPHLGHEIFEIGVITRTIYPDGFQGVDAEYLWQMAPGDLSAADPAALRVNRFYDRHDSRYAAALIEAPSKESNDYEPTDRDDIAKTLALVLDGAYLVGAAPHFDAMFLGGFLRENGQCPTWHHRLVCVETLVAGALRQPVPAGLKGSADAMGVKYDPDELHTALADARLARDVYDAVMGGGVR